MWHGLEGIGWGWIGLGILHMGLFWILIFACLGALLWVMRGPAHQSALEVLKMRYARGELTQEQFDRMKRELPPGRDDNDDAL
jgi:putative membrane protein